jgi:hypothetical protein
LLENNFIHQFSDQVNSATVIGHNILGSSWIWYCANIEALSLIANRDRYLPVLAAAGGDTNAFSGIFMIAVDDSIRKRFAHGDFDIDFASISFPEPLDEAHQLIEGRRDGFDLARKTLLQLNVGTGLGTVVLTGERS